GSAIGTALAQAVAKVKPFDVTLGGLGAFPDQAHPRILWVGVERHPALELLANDVEGVLGRFGFEPELRPLQPHMTIGRAARDAGRGALQQVTEQLGTVEYAGVIPV